MKAKFCLTYFESDTVHSILGVALSSNQMDERTAYRRELIVIGYIHYIQDSMLALRDIIIPQEICRICMEYYYLLEAPCMLAVSMRYKRIYRIDCNTLTTHLFAGQYQVGSSSICSIPNISDGRNRSFHGFLLENSLFVYNAHSVKMDDPYNTIQTVNMGSFKSIEPPFQCPYLLYCDSMEMVVCASNQILYSLNVSNILDDLKQAEWREIKENNDIPHSLGEIDNGNWRMTYLSKIDTLFIIEFIADTICGAMAREMVGDHRDLQYGNDGDLVRNQSRCPCGIFNLRTGRWMTPYVSPMFCEITANVAEFTSICNDGQDTVYVLCWEYHFAGDMILQSFDVMKNKWTVLCQYRDYKMEEPAVIWYDESCGIKSIKMLTKEGTLYVWDCGAKRKRWVQEHNHQFWALSESRYYRYYH